MEQRGTFQAIINKMFEEEEFLMKLVSSSKDVRREALKEFFPGNPKGLETAVETLNRIVDSPTRDVMKEFVFNCDGVKFGC